MMIKFSILISMASLLNFTASMAQQASASSSAVANPMTKDTKNSSGVVPNVEGSPYLNDTYVEGEIYQQTKRTVVPVRYNAFQDLIEYQQNGKPLVLDPNKTIKKVRMGDVTFVVEKFEYKGKPKNGFLSLLDSGKVMLFSKKSVKYMELQKGRALDGGDIPAKFSRVPDVYFYKIGNGPVLEVDNIKSMIASFPDKQDELKQFAKQEKISPKKEDELIKLTKYYNSL